MHLLGGRSFSSEALVASEAVENTAVVVVVVQWNAEHVRGLFSQLSLWRFGCLVCVRVPVWDGVR